MSVFYESYGAAKNYSTPTLNRKHIARFDTEVWQPAGLKPVMRCLEIGCGTGHFLSYLHHKGIDDLKAIDLDQSLSDVIPDAVRDKFEAVDVWAYLEKTADRQMFERIFLFDVLEHFVPEDGYRLLTGLSGLLTPDGAIILKDAERVVPLGLAVPVRRSDASGSLYAGQHPPDGRCLRS